MSQEFIAGDSEHAPAPRQIVEAILEQSRAGSRNLPAFVEAINFCRRHLWKDLEAELYARLGIAILKQEAALDDATAEALAQESAATTLTGEAHVMLRTLLAGISRARGGTTGLLSLATAFESMTDDATAGWQARLMMGAFLDGLRRADVALAAQTRRRLMMRIADWIIDYHLTESAADIELRTHAAFGVLMIADWSDAAAENAQRGLDGAFHCAVERLTRSATTEWFIPFLDELTPKVAAHAMHRRLTRETLYRIGEVLTTARRLVYHRSVAGALALSTLEEAIHRPHRRQLDRTPVKLELELPGPRGFQGGGQSRTRLRVFDISRDGCLAVTEGPARFEETSAAVKSLSRAGGRAFDVRRLSGVLRQGSAEWDVRPETSLVLHDASRRSEWAAIDGASIVRVTPDKASNRLWVGFHFDRMMPQVQQEIEMLVYGAA